MSTKADLLQSWVKWTGDPVAKVRHRIRSLSEAGLLPKGNAPLTRDHLAAAILGFLLTDTHKDAAEAVRKALAGACGRRFLGRLWSPHDWDGFSVRSSASLPDQYSNQSPIIVSRSVSFRLIERLLADLGLDHD